MSGNYRFFQNKECQYFPCHKVETEEKDIEDVIERFRFEKSDKRRLMSIMEAAIRKMITDMSCVSGAEILFETNEKQLSFDEDEENAIYRIIQESITNALRHGKASKIRIEMEKVDGEIRLTIRDNGVGCKEIKSGFGIKHIQERAEMLHGRVTFDGREGFTVFAIIPIRWGEKYD